MLPPDQFLSGDNLPQTAQEVEDGLREFLSQKLGAIPPSEQDKLSPDIKLALAQEVKAGHSLYYQVFNVREPAEAYQVEQLLMNKGVKVLFSDVAFSPAGDLLYVITCQVTNGMYQKLRADFVPPPDTKEDDSEVVEEPQRFMDRVWRGWVWFASKMWWADPRLY